MAFVVCVCLLEANQYTLSPESCRAQSRSLCIFSLLRRQNAPPLERRQRSAASMKRNWGRCGSKRSVIYMSCRRAVSLFIVMAGAHNWVFLLQYVSRCIKEGRP